MGEGLIEKKNNSIKNNKKKNEEKTKQK